MLYVTKASLQWRTQSLQWLTDNQKFYAFKQKQGWCAALLMDKIILVCFTTRITSFIAPFVDQGMSNSTLIV